MFKLWKKSDKKEAPAEKGDALPWSDQAKAGLEQALAQSPVPSMMKNMVKKELAQSAEHAARAAGHSEVTAEDLMQGLMAKLPDNMRRKVEEAAKGGPEELKKLQDELKNKS